MKKTMKRITAILLVLSVVFVLLNFYLKTDLFLTLSITFCTALYHFAMRLFVGEICNKFIEPKLNYNAKWFNQPVIHRIIDIKEINGKTVYEIKGDNNNRSDPYYVTADQIQAKVIKWGDKPVVIPYIGTISLWLRGL